AVQQARPSVGGLAGESLDRRAASGLKGRLEHEVFRRIAGDEQFRERDEIGAIARGLLARLTRTFQIAGNVADRGIKLRHGNSETIGRTLIHGQALTPDHPVRQPGSCDVNERKGAFLQSAATAGNGLALACRSDFNKSASRNERSSDCSALSRGSQTV